jgi:ribosomal protein S27E
MTCPNCGSTKNPYIYFDKNHFKWVRCLDCKHEELT